MSTQPNILLLFPDQWRRDWTGLADGVGIDTPNINALAQRGVTFTNAWCPSPLCAPSRACLASGREYHRTGVPDNSVNYPADLPTFYQALRGAGYAVLGCGKFDLHKPDYVWGPDGTNHIDQWGFTAGVDSEGKIDGVNAYLEGSPGPYLRYLQAHGQADAYVANMKERAGALVARTAAVGDEEYGDNWVTRNGLALLRTVESGRPWFLQVNFTGPHSPFDITPRMAAWYADRPMPATTVSGAEAAGRGDDGRVVAMRRNYSAMCRNIDERIGDFLRFLDQTGQTDRTVVIFASDHGEMLGDRDRWGKCWAHTASLGVPLVIAGAGIGSGSRSSGAAANVARGAGERIDRPVSTLGLTTTILEAAGLPPLPGSDSRSLFAAVGAVVRAALAYGGRYWRTVIDDRFKLIVNGDGTTELYAYCDDPAERRNLAAAEPAIVARLTAQLPPDQPTDAAITAGRDQQ